MASFFRVTNEIRKRTSIAQETICSVHILHLNTLNMEVNTKTILINIKCCFVEKYSKMSASIYIFSSEPALIRGDSICNHIMFALLVDWLQPIIICPFS